MQEFKIFLNCFWSFRRSNCWWNYNCSGSNTKYKIHKVQSKINELKATKPRRILILIYIYWPKSMELNSQTHKWIDKFEVHNNKIQQLGFQNTLLENNWNYDLVQIQNKTGAQRITKSKKKAKGLLLNK
jgi:hypothetical protein